MGPSDDHELPTEELPAAQPRGPALVRRRWTVFGKAGSGVVILATAGAIAAGAPANAVDETLASQGGDGGELSVEGGAAERDSNPQIGQSS